MTRLNRFGMIDILIYIQGDGIMLFQESETIELKEVVVDDIKKEIIAFANCDGRQTVYRDPR